MNATATQPKIRIESIDVLRGIIMVIMALDHTRDFLTNQKFNPTDLTKASTVLFLTRFITHYCAPGFAFLAGTGAFLYQSNGKTKGQLSRFLITRGLWLILLELTLVNWAVSISFTGPSFNFNYGFVMLLVFWVLGIGMILLAALIYLPVRVIAILGLILIFGHNALDNIDPKNLGNIGGTIWQFLHVQSIVTYAGGSRSIFVVYPIIPWAGVMAVGYSFGELFKLERDKRKRILTIIGWSAIALFIIIRLFNIYGDPNHWVSQGTWYRTVLSFINAQKQPPSLDFLLITLGPAILALAYLEGIKNKVTDIFRVYGRVPLFYFLLHLYLLQFLAFIIYHITKLVHITYGFGLPVIYAVWLLAVIILYFPCRWYMKYKSTHKQWWLGYL